jgi:hypothetical protein
MGSWFRRGRGHKHEEREEYEGGREKTWGERRLALLPIDRSGSHYGMKTLRLGLVSG